jgi:hypothetical protein
VHGKGKRNNKKNERAKWEGKRGGIEGGKSQGRKGSERIKKKREHTTHHAYKKNVS